MKSKYERVPVKVMHRRDAGSQQVGGREGVARVGREVQEGVARVGREVCERPAQCTEDTKWAWSKKGGMAKGATAGATVPSSTEVKCGHEDNGASMGPCPAMLK